MFLGVWDFPKHPAADNLPLISALIAPETGIIQYARPKQGDAIVNKFMPEISRVVTDRVEHQC
ncbi:MAG: hypothetical protein CMJ35_06245 [Phycisphaerae bacterium]|nr:hypothetical protein [Phycisphaerae bacterium]MBM91197.1 hypothetical protein [Phycisphaerae bacterium]HCT45347.1 hypothetical protein [Phycisphaerales bacterium]